MIDQAVYVGVEGGEGAGKSTLARGLAAHLGAVLTRETGGTRIGMMTRAILADPANSELTGRAEALLIAADRAQHLDEVVLPALAAGRHVVSDRTVYSTLAYQVYGRGLPSVELLAINDFAVGARWPDLVIYLRADADLVAARLAGRDLDRFERAPTEFHARVHAGFDTLAAAGAAGELRSVWVTLDAGLPRELVLAASTVAADTYQALPAGMSAKAAASEIAARVDPFVTAFARSAA